MTRLKDRGVLDRITAEWEGKEYSDALDEAPTDVLSPGQVVLVYFIMVLALGTSLVTLAAERAWKWLEGGRGASDSSSADLHYDLKCYSDGDGRATFCANRGLSPLPPIK